MTYIFLQVSKGRNVLFCLSSTTTYSTRKTILQMPQSLHLSTWGLFKQVTPLTWQNSSSFYCYCHSSISVSLLLCFLESWDLPRAFSQTLPQTLHLSEKLVSTCSPGEISLCCCSSQDNSNGVLASRILICFQTFFHFLIWFLSTLWIWNPPSSQEEEYPRSSSFHCYVSPHSLGSVCKNSKANTEEEYVSPQGASCFLSLLDLTAKASFLL